MRQDLQARRDLLEKPGLLAPRVPPVKPDLPAPRVPPVRPVLLVLRDL